MDSQGTACSTPRTNEIELSEGETREINCPTCDTPVEQKRVGGSIRRFCNDSCRWAWNRRDRRLKRIKAVENAACSSCREAVLKALGERSMETPTLV